MHGSRKFDFVEGFAAFGISDAFTVCGDREWQARLERQISIEP
jgi:hypothetical protein